MRPLASSDDGKLSAHVWLSGQGKFKHWFTLNSKLATLVFVTVLPAASITTPPVTYTTYSPSCPKVMFAL